MAKLTEKLVQGILKHVEKFFIKMVYIKKAYSENVMVKGFHSVRFFHDMGQLIFLGNDSVKNKNKINNVSRRLLNECKEQVGKDIQEYIEEVKKLKKKRKKK